MSNRRRKAFFPLALLLTMAGCGEADNSQNEFVLRNVVLVSPERETPLENAWVAIRDDRVAGVGSGGIDPQFLGARIVDGEGRYVTPGLIDGHVHVADSAAIPSALTSLVGAYNDQLPKSYLYFGYTTLVDLNNAGRVFQEAFSKSPYHPDLFECAGALVLANGYPMVFVPPETRFQRTPNFLYDARQADAIPKEFPPEEHTPAATVKRVADAGGICVKTHWEDGFGRNNSWPTPTREMIADVIKESHARNLTVAMHANSSQAQRFAVDAGVDVIAHGLFDWDNGALLPDGDLPASVTAILDDIAAKNIGFMPTIQVLEGTRLMYDPGFLDDPRLAKVVPADVIEWYRTAEGRWFAEQLRGEAFGGAPDDQVRARLEDGMRLVRRTTGYLAQRNARLLFGSDTPSAPVYGNPPGYNGYMEVQRLAESGVSLRQILTAATIANAKAFHLDDRYGTVESGKIANLLVLDRNPLESVEAWDSIHAVVVHGQWIERSTLSAR